MKVRVSVDHDNGNAHTEVKVAIRRGTIYEMVLIGGWWIRAG